MAWTRRSWLKVGLQVVITTSISGCGTILYPERRGQRAGAIDWRVVALDGLGLLFFFIPGVIAFAVDFINGTIYLPSESSPCEPPCLPTPTSARDRKSSGKLTQLQPISVPRKDLTPRGIERIVAQRTGKTISLEEGRYSTRKLQTIDEFWKTHDSFDGHSFPNDAEAPRFDA